VRSRRRWCQSMISKAYLGTWFEPRSLWGKFHRCPGLSRNGEKRRTGWQWLLQFLGLLRILQDESIQVSLASDLELNLRRLLVALYAGSYLSISLCPWLSVLHPVFSRGTCMIATRVSRGVFGHSGNVHEASLRLQISMNYLLCQFLLKVYILSRNKESAGNLTFLMSEISWGILAVL
jgi:hypothetical protein